MKRPASAVFAAFLAASLAAPQAAFASFARASGLGLYGYVYDEAADMDLNPAFAADIRGGRVFGRFFATGTRNNSRSTSSFHTRQVSYTAMLEGLNSFGSNVVSLRANPSGTNNKSSSTTLPSGPTTSSSYRYRTSEDWRLLWARSLGGGQAGVALSRQLVSFENRDSSSGSLGSHRANHGVDAGWFSGPRGASRLGLSASFDYADLSGHDSANPGPLTGHVTDSALRAVWESPLWSSSLRVIADADDLRAVADYTDTAGLDFTTDGDLFYRLGAGLEVPAAPDFRWVLSLEGNYELRRTVKDNVVITDVTTFSRFLDGSGVIGFEKDFSAHWTGRVRATFFNFSQSRSRDTSGAINSGRYMQGPFSNYAAGFSWSPRPTLSFDFLFDQSAYNIRANTRTAFNDSSSRTLTVNACATYRFGQADPAKTTPAEGS